MDLALLLKNVHETGNTEFHKVRHGSFSHASIYILQVCSTSRNISTFQGFSYSIHLLDIFIFKPPATLSFRIDLFLTRCILGSVLLRYIFVTVKAEYYLRGLVSLARHSFLEKTESSLTAIAVPYTHTTLHKNNTKYFGNMAGVVSLEVGAASLNESPWEVFSPKKYHE